MCNNSGETLIDASQQVKVLTATEWIIYLHLYSLWQVQNLQQTSKHTQNSKFYWFQNILFLFFHTIYTFTKFWSELGYLPEMHLNPKPMIIATSMQYNYDSFWIL